MARPREYNREAVLDAATDLFWKKGFHGTSLSELVAATRLNKQSMYQEFKNKAGLFNACLEYYSHKMGKTVIGILTEQPLTVENIRLLFARQQELLNSPDFKGCLFINSAGEQPFLDASARQRVADFFKRLEELFNNCLLTAFSPAEARLKADYLVHLFTGIMTVGKIRHNTREGAALVKLALNILEQ